MNIFYNRLSRFCAIVLLVLFATGVYGKIQLPPMFSNNMVLQQKTDAPLWGKAASGKEVSLVVSWDKARKYTTTADNKGNWKIKVATPEAGGPYTINISDGKNITLENVMIGEVWVCSGQSNMEMQLDGWGKVTNYEQEVATANFPNIRLLHVEKATSTTPLTDVVVAGGGWQVCNPQTVANFSAVAYFFGRDLNQSQHVPIGLISTSWGGTIAEAWTSGESLKTMPDFTNAVQKMETDDAKLTDTERKEKYKREVSEWQNKVMALDKGYRQNIPEWAAMNFKADGWKTMRMPSNWEKTELSSFDGIAWFRKIVEIPEKWAGKELMLSLGGIDDNDVTFFNGKEVGRTDGWDKMRTYTIPAKDVKKGEVTIAIRVLDNNGAGGMYGPANHMKLKTTSGESIDLTGDWLYQISVDVSNLPAFPQADEGPNRPTVLYNAMINPLVPYGIRGAIWYQGESNDRKAYQYRELFPLMITDWRKHWGCDFPFFFVQLANFQDMQAEPSESDWAELREAQLHTLAWQNTGMAVTIDIGDARDIHPKNKQDVGKRLALNARAKVYGEKITYSGPIYQSYKVEGNKVRIRFAHADSGLKSVDGGALKGFAVAGLDHKFHWATAVIEGDEVVVTCPQVDFPVAVRYAWAKNPACNLVNGAGLPASPFRTDDWQGVTYGIK